MYSKQKRFHAFLHSAPMAYGNRRKKQPPIPPLVRSTSYGPSAPTFDHPASVLPISDLKGNGKTETPGHRIGVMSFAETPPQLLNPPSVRLQAPIRWVYNYDHTDPLNFGFMFPVEPGYSTELSSLNTRLVSSPLSPPASASTYGSTRNPISPQFKSPRSSTRGGKQWDLTPSSAEPGFQQSEPSAQQSLASGFYEDHLPIHQGLPYRYNPYHGGFAPVSAQDSVHSPSGGQIW